MKEVFISRPNWVPESFEKGLKIFYNILKANGLNPRTIGRSDYPSRSPLDEVIKLLKKCEGSIVLGIPQIQIEKGTIKGEQINSAIYLGTEWNHIEAALSHFLDLPMLLIHHKSVIRGIFDRGACNSYLHEIDMEEPEWSTSDDITGAILNWKEELKNPITSKSQSFHEEVTPTLKWGAYKFGTEPGLFCPVCYEKKGLKMPVSRINTKFHQCPNCRAQLS